MISAALPRKAAHAQLNFFYFCSLYHSRILLPLLSHRNRSSILSMALEKRKRVREATEPDNDRPEKKPKPSKPVSRLVAPKEEPAFQRGGASILTPLEQKQIQVQATRDVLFEQRTGQKARNIEFGEDENEEDGIAEPAAALRKFKRKTPKRPERNGSMPEPEESGIRIEALGYKVRYCR